MKKMSIWRRLNTSTVILIVLLLAGAALAFWVEKSRYDSTVRNDKLDTKAGNVLWRLDKLSYTQMRLLVNPQSAPDQKLNDQAGKELTEAISDIQNNYDQYDDLMKSLRNIRDYAVQMMPSFQQTNVDLQEAEGMRRDEILAEFAKQKEIAKGIDSESSRLVSLWGFAGLVVILFLSIAVIIYQSRVVSRPLAQLVGALERMRQGDFTRRVEIEGNDDFGVLGNGLNRLADDLSVLVGQVQRSGIQVNSTAAEIAATAKQQQSTASEIAKTTAGIGVTSKQISATSRELVKTMNEVSEVAHEAARVAGSGQAAISSMEATMRQIMEASGSITGKLAVLNEKTSNINSVVTTITKVADQTNLLSLNAAIEAEKAGEYGLGFGVVAMEIRRLADQTAVATYDIEKMVKEMQSAVAAGVRGMDKFSEEVRQGVEEIRQVSVQLARIIHQVQALTPRFQTVNDGMQSQAAGAQNISETLTQLSEAVHQTAESLRQSTQAIEQLNDAARGLQSGVTRFKLEGS
jgi:methyl-accepting chemotaxis protein WspA